MLIAKNNKTNIYNNNNTITSLDVLSFWRRSTMYWQVGLAAALQILIRDGLGSNRGRNISYTD
jgi:hypothetical protein